MEQMRLQKFLAEAGVASRRKAEVLILQRRVSVNGKIISDMGVKVSDDDSISVDGKKVKKEEKKVYIMLNKPEGYVTTVKDQFSRETVIDLVKDIKERVYPVGRLDYDTSGLLILSNDGEFTFRMTHPGHEVQKVYLAEVKGLPDEEVIGKFKTGIKIEDYTTAPAEFEIVKKNTKTTVVRVTIHEGKNRQVRKMFEVTGYPILTLKRVAIGSLKLGKLPEGKWRFLSEEEIKQMS